LADQNAYGKSLEVNWQLDSITIDATLVRPPGPGPFSGVVMVAGSGPTDRDWNSPLLPGPSGSARLVAEVLGQASIASLRYDKRASGPRAMENLTLSRINPGDASRFNMATPVTTPRRACPALQDIADSEAALQHRLSSSSGISSKCVHTFTQANDYAWNRHSVREQCGTNVRYLQGTGAIHPPLKSRGFLASFL
jgi:hypothetical protein